jgi:DNA-directed RNA polymerase subunit RPC12/RpoP
MRNKYPGKCICCGKPVPAGAGHPEKVKNGWRVRCLACVGKKLPDANP